jgi:hypothetical protein
MPQHAHCGSAMCTGLRDVAPGRGDISAPRPFVTGTPRNVSTVSVRELVVPGTAGRAS